MEINVGAVISAFRKQKGVTQEALADFVGVSKASVSKWRLAKVTLTLRCCQFLLLILMLASIN